MSADWTGEAQELAALEPPARQALSRLTPMEVPEGTCLFSPGEVVKGYVIVLTGHVGVYLVGPNGRDILLYEVTPGEACIQSTLGLLGGEDYSAEAVVSRPTRLVLVPRPVFLELLDSSAAFRKVVFAAFAERMQAMMQLIETMSFLKVEARLAALILDRSEGDRLEMTQAEMARAIGTAREVVSRRLDRLARDGMIGRERGQVIVLDREGLENIIEHPAV
ncbi:Crp/Fnr family transcriptional regulator [Maritimibacter dapengensis]|uniref:Crp/Fnr family transcriptional regulator n=1 Tax=Maritimibacter dapengensis TaxID=2836868 RepID=A0ABS6T1Y5_9RHOB|nr:Crp/Fnr family transcriptional regulator [Maritimibacter dapengensis]MBV7379249.1 Crp/Fnr family transcriptional regulator [Maritimibacter dapengensis]